VLTLKTATHGTPASDGAGHELAKWFFRISAHQSGHWKLLARRCLLRFIAFTHAYCHGKYAEALEAAVRINMPGFFYAQAALAEALGQLGHREAARKAVQDLLALRPDFATTARHEYSKWFEPEQVEHLVDGLRKAGLEIPANQGDASA